MKDGLATSSRWYRSDGIIKVDLPRSCVEKNGGVEMQFVMAHVIALQELILAHLVCLRAVGQDHLVVEDHVAYVRRQVCGVIRSRPTFSRTIRTLRQMLKG